MSAFSILSVNSWMQTPQSHGVNEAGQFVPLDWWAIVFNPSFPYRLVHMVRAACLTTAVLVGAAGAWHLLRRPDSRVARVMRAMAMWMALIFTPIQIAAGDAHGLNTLEHQPARIAAMEGHFAGFPQGRAPLILFGLPDDAAEGTRYKVELPWLGNLILRHDLTSPIPGLKDFPPEDRPKSALIFSTFRIMVAVGVAMPGLGLWAARARWKGRLYDSPWLHRAAFVMGPSGFWPCPAAGSRPKWGASPSPSMASCALPTALRRFPPMR